MIFQKTRPSLGKTKHAAARSLILSLKESTDVEKRFTEIVIACRTDQNLRQEYKDAVEQLARGKNYLRLLTEKGIGSNRRFLQVFKKYCLEKVLPEYENPKEAAAVLQYLFPKADDYRWISEISEELWSQLFSLLFEKEIYKLSASHPLLWQILNALQILSVRINALGLTPDILEKLPELEKFESPFMALHREVIFYIEHYQKDHFDRSTKSEDFRQLMILFGQCEDYVKLIKNRKGIFGVSLDLSVYLIGLSDTLKRFRLLLNLITTPDDDLLFREEISLFKGIVKAHCQQKSLRFLIARHLGLITNQITQRISQVGEKYVTMSWPEYGRMFYSSSKAGVIVGALSVFKVLIYSLHLSLFGTAFLYSANYSLGFILIHLVDGKLATKQPAMTASHLAQAIDSMQAGGENKHRVVSHLFVHILRSQFIAFAGNLLLAFPAAVAISAAYYFLFDSYFIDTKKAVTMIGDVHPFESGSIFFAALAGVYLFFSGLIVGYYDNFCIVARIPARVKKLCLVQKLLSQRSVVRLGRYLEGNLGALAGNFYLGVFLGVTSTLGIILGLPLDIRHITFSAANLGLAAYRLDFNFASDEIFWCVTGVLLIGIVNLIVSFGLATLMAIKSRQLSFKDYRGIFRETCKIILSNPLRLLIPLSSDKKDSEWLR